MSARRGAGGSARRERLPGNPGSGARTGPAGEAEARPVHARGDRREGGPGTLPFLAPHTHARARPEPSCPRRPGSPCGTGRRGPGSSGGSRSWPRAEDLPRRRPRRPARPRPGQSQGREAAAAAAAAAAAGEEAAREAAAAAAGWWPWRLGREGAGREGGRASGAPGRRRLHRSRCLREAHRMLLRDERIHSNPGSERELGEGRKRR